MSWALCHYSPTPAPSLARTCSQMLTPENPSFLPRWAPDMATFFSARVSHFHPTEWHNSSPVQSPVQSLFCSQQWSLTTSVKNNVLCNVLRKYIKKGQGPSSSLHGELFPGYSSEWDVHIRKRISPSLPQITSDIRFPEPGKVRALRPGDIRQKGVPLILAIRAPSEETERRIDQSHLQNNKEKEWWMLC